MLQDIFDAIRAGLSYYRRRRWLRSRTRNIQLPF
jgi:hypothetical protein